MSIYIGCQDCGCIFYDIDDMKLNIELIIEPCCKNSLTTQLKHIGTIPQTINELTRNRDTKKKLHKQILDGTTQIK